MREGQGVLGIFALLLPLSRDQNRGGERAASAALAGSPWGFGGGRGEGEKGEGGQEARFLATARAEADRSSLATRAGGRRAAALWWRHCGLGRRASGGG